MTYGEKGCLPGRTHVDETYAAPVPAECPSCRGAVEVTRVASQYEEELPVTRPLVRRFAVGVGHCSRCRRRVQGHHPLQTSDALGAAGTQFGPGSASLVVELHTELGVPLAKVASVLRNTFGVQVLRRCTQLQEDHPRSSWAAEVQTVLQTGVDLRDRCHAGTVGRHGMASARGPLEARLAGLGDAPPRFDDARRFAAHVGTESPAVFLFLADPSVDATN